MGKVRLGSRPQTGEKRFLVVFCARRQGGSVCRACRIRLAANVSARPFTQRRHSVGRCWQMTVRCGVRGAGRAPRARVRRPMLADLPFDSRRRATTPLWSAGAAGVIGEHVDGNTRARTRPRATPTPPSPPPSPSPPLPPPPPLSPPPPSRRRCFFPGPVSRVQAERDCVCVSAVCSVTTDGGSA